MNKKTSLTIEEFRKLPRAEQNERECELSDHDRFLARVEDWEFTPPVSDVISEKAQLVHVNKEKEAELLLRLFNSDTDYTE